MSNEQRIAGERHLEGPPLERWREQRAYEREQEAARERAADRAIGSVADLEA